MKRLLALPVALLLLSCSTTGKVKEPAELTEVAEPKATAIRLWSASPGQGPDRYVTGLRLALEPDGLFAADTEGKVFALDPETGKLRWSRATGARVVSGPTVSGNLVLVGTLDAEVLALSRADGAIAWRAPVSSEVMAPPVGSGDIVVVKAGDGRVFGLSAGNGERIWSFDRTVPTLTLRGLSAPLIVGSRVAVGMDSGRLFLLKLADGKPVWEQAVAVPSGRSELERITDIDGDLAASPDLLYAVSFGGELAALSLADGEVSWRRSIRSYASLALPEDLVVTTDEDSVIWALDARSGAAVWKQEGLLHRRVSAPVPIGDQIAVVDGEGYLHLLARNDGRIVGRAHPLGEAVVGAPVVSGDRLFLQGSDGAIVALRVTPAG